MERIIPRISATLEDRQEEHQSTMIELEGIFANQPVFVLIDLGYHLTFVGPQLVESYKLKT